MNDSPRIGVVIPAYNAAAYIAEALESVFAQTYKNLEVIVVNDGSPDTPALEAALSPFLARIRYIRQENTGTAGARNTALRATDAELIALLDADDAWVPDCLETQLRYLREHPDVDVVYGDAVFRGGSLSGRRYMELFPTIGEVTFEGLVSRRCYVMISVLAKREAIARAGLFCENVRCEDFELWGRMLKMGFRIGYHRKVILNYRCQENQKSGDYRANLLANIVVYEKFRREHALTAKESEAIEAKLNEYRGELILIEAKQEFVNRNFRNAVAKLDEANAILRRPRLSAVSLALRIVPDALHAAYRIREQRIAKRLAAG